MAVQQPVERLRTFGQLRKICFLERLGGRVEKRPGIALFEDFMPGLPPLMQNAGNQLVREDSDITRPDDEIMDDTVIQARELVGGGPGVLMMPAIHELAHSRLDELR